MGNEFDGAELGKFRGLAGGLLCAKPGALSNMMAARVASGTLGRREVSKNRKCKSRVLLRLEDTEVLILLDLVEILLFRMLRLERRR